MSIHRLSHYALAICRVSHCALSTCTFSHCVYSILHYDTVYCLYIDYDTVLSLHTLSHCVVYTYIITLLFSICTLSHCVLSICTLSHFVLSIWTLSPTYCILYTSMVTNHSTNHKVMLTSGFDGCKHSTSYPVYFYNCCWKNGEKKNRGIHFTFNLPAKVIHLILLQILGDKLQMETMSSHIKNMSFCINV